MTKSQAIAFFGTQANLGLAIGINQGSISSWGEFPPPIRQMQIEVASNGALKAEKNLLEVARKAAQNTKHIKAVA